MPTDHAPNAHHDHPRGHHQHYYHSPHDRSVQRRLDLYEVLQVSTRAQPAIVQAAYRVLARANHPDLNPSPEAARLMRQINAAYMVLSDPVRRAKYDADRSSPWRARRNARVQQQTTAEQPVAERRVRVPTARAHVSRRGQFGRSITIPLMVIVLASTLVVALMLLVDSFDGQGVAITSRGDLVDIVGEPAGSAPFDAPGDVGPRP